MIFLFDRGKAYSYDDLLSSLNDGTTYYPYYKTSDIYAFFVNLIKAMYASSKGALEAFSKDTAREWGVLGIRSNCVVPGFMETAMSARLTEEQRGKIYARTSLKAATSKESVAEMVAFLLSDKAESVTAQSIHVDNGTI